MNVRKTATLTATLATVATLALTVTPQAQARVTPVSAGPVAAPDDCGAGALCAYARTDYTGGMNWTSRDRAAYTGDWTGFISGRSVYNNAATYTARDGSRWGHCVTLYSGSHYTGRQLTLRPHTGISSIPASFGHVRSNRWADCKM